MYQTLCHKRTRKHLLLAFFALLAVGTPGVLGAAASTPAAGSPASAPNAAIIGDWQITMDFGGRPMLATLSISSKPDGTLTGRWGSTEVSNVKFDGQKLTFVRKLKMGDQEFTMNYEGVLKDGKLTGKLSSENGDFDANGTRKKPKSPVLGQWELKYQIGDQAVTAKLIVSQKPDGTPEAKWTTTFGESVVSNVKIQDGKLTLSRKTTFNDTTFESTYEGTVKGDDLTGTMKSQMGDIQANGRRLGRELIGNWEMTSNSDMGPFTSTLMVDPDLTARLETFGSETPVKDLKLENGQLTYVIEMNFGDQPFRIEFKGKLDGQTIKGQTITPNGTNETTAKKIVSPAAPESKPAKPATVPPAVKPGTTPADKPAAGR